MSRKRLGRRILPAALLLSLPAASFAESQRPRFRVSVEEVVVEAVVTRRDRPLAGLTAEDFVLLDQGVRREVRLVSQEDLPLSLLFVMDASESVTSARRSRLSEAAGHVASRLPGGDRCAVAVFASELTLAHDFAECAALPPDPFPTEGVTGGTALWDSVVLAAALAEEAAGRAAIVIFTDGEDTMSWTPEGFVEEALWGSGAVLYAVVPPDARGTERRQYRYGRINVTPPSVQRRQRIGIRRMNGGIVSDELAVLLDGPRRQRRPRTGARAPSELQLLRHVAEGSGGRLIESRDEESLLASYAAILEDMRSRYVLAFQPDPNEPPGWRRLEVTVKPDGARVRARRGYVHRAPGR